MVTISNTTIICRTKDAFQLVEAKPMWIQVKLVKIAQLVAIIVQDLVNAIIVQADIILLNKAAATM